MDSTQEQPTPTLPLESGDVEYFGWSFHRWPLLIAVAIVVLLYTFIFLFVDPNPPYFDPATLPPPPPGK
jgi:hypothetical protein